MSLCFSVITVVDNRDGNYRTCSLIHDIDTGISQRCLDMLTLILLRPEYTRRTRSIPCLLMAWLLASTGHQVPQDLKYLGNCNLVASRQCSFILVSNYRDHFRHGLSQWETMLHYNVVSHWLSQFQGWILNYYWIKYWLIVWWHQAITWTNVDLLSIRS